MRRLADEGCDCCDAACGCADCASCDGQGMRIPFAETMESGRYRKR